MASTAPTGTSLPSGATIELSTPAAGAVTSTVTLSVSSSTSGSSAATASPSCFIQRPTVADVTLSPSVGTLISVAMARASLQPMPSAAATSVACSRVCTRAWPVAGLAAASRPT